jgi:hypothetical protein
VLGIDVLPAGEEAQELRGADRLDLAPQPLDGVAVDARQQAALAERGAPVDARAAARRLPTPAAAAAPRLRSRATKTGPSASNRPRSTAFGSRVASAAK